MDVTPTSSSGTTSTPGPSGAASPTNPPVLPPPVSIPSEPGAGMGEKRETARRNIAYVAIFVFFAFLAVPLAGWFLGWYTLDDSTKMITTISGVLAGIVGAIIGFYFRAEEND